MASGIETRKITFFYNIILISVVHNSYYCSIILFYNSSATTIRMSSCILLKTLVKTAAKIS